MSCVLQEDNIERAQPDILMAGKAAGTRCLTQARQRLVRHKRTRGTHFADSELPVHRALI